MTRRNVLVALAVTFALLFLADWAAGRLAQNSVPRRLMRTINSAPARIDVLGIGNSLMAAGFDSKAFEATFLKAGRPVIAVNAGIGATSVIEPLVLARLAFEHH